MLKVGGLKGSKWAAQKEKNRQFKRLRVDFVILKKINYFKLHFFVLSGVDNCYPNGLSAS